MRVIAGRLSGQNFEAPATHRTHPMSERVRGALFNALGDIEGLSVLDCFGGSGALSIEAASRGAARATVVELDNTAHKTIQTNLRRLGLSDSVKAVRANVSSWSSNNPEARFDLVLCNPPFDHLRPELIQKLARHVKKGGVLVLCWPPEALPDLTGLKLAKTKGYGDAQLAFYKC